MTSDSSDVCHISLSGVRKHTSFRCDSELWRVFKQICVKNGLSTCDILEKLIMGFCIGITQPRVAQPTTINVVVDAPRVVKRVRRQLVFEGEVESVESQSLRVLCVYCDGALGEGRVFCQRRGMWIPSASCYSCEKNQLRKKK